MRNFLVSAVLSCQTDPDLRLTQDGASVELSVTTDATRRAHSHG